MPQTTTATRCVARGGYQCHVTIDTQGKPAYVLVCAAGGDLWVLLRDAERAAAASPRSTVKREAALLAYQALATHCGQV